MSIFTDRLRTDRNPFDNWDIREQAADKIEKLEERIEALEALQIRPHELKAMYDTVAYLRSLARIFPDKDGDTFSTKMQSYAQIIEDMVERIEAQQ